MRQTAHADRLATHGDTRALTPHGTTMSIHTNDICIARFSAWVSTQRKLSFARYRTSLQRGLSVRRRAQLTRQAILDTVEKLFREALKMLYELPFDARSVRVERGWSALTLPHSGTLPHLSFFHVSLDQLNELPDGLREKLFAAGHVYVTAEQHVVRGLRLVGSAQQTGLAGGMRPIEIC